jgi:transposase
MGKPKRSRRGRQLRALELRREGHSLREIATALDCSIGTVHNDLRDAAKVFNLPVQKRLSRGPGLNTECDSKSDSSKIIPLRRRT